MDYNEFQRFISRISATMGCEGEEFADYIVRMVQMLDGTDSDDTWGTEGWKHHIGFPGE